MWLPQNLLKIQLLKIPEDTSEEETCGLLSDSEGGGGTVQPKENHRVLITPISTKNHETLKNLGSRCLSE
jgi:hypothetical protein